MGGCCRRVEVSSPSSCFVVCALHLLARPLTYIMMGCGPLQPPGEAYQRAWRLHTEEAHEPSTGTARRSNALPRGLGSPLA